MIFQLLAITEQFCTCTLLVLKDTDRSILQELAYYCLNINTFVFFLPKHLMANSPIP